MSLENILVSIIEALFQSLAASTIIFKQVDKSDKKSKLIFYLLMWGYGLITYYLIPNQLRFIMFVVIIALVLRFVLNIKDKKVLLFSFNTEIILSFSEIVVSLLFVIIGIKSTDVVNNIYINLVVNILISAFSIVFVKFNFINKLLQKIIHLFKKNKKLINYLYIFIVILYLIILKNGFEFLLKSNYYMNIIFILGIVFILTIIIRNEYKYDQINEQNKQMLNYVTKYEKIITEQGKANHEFKNQLMVIRGYAQMNSPKLIEYLDSIVEDVNKTHSSYLISQLNKFPDGGIKGLLYYKLSTMDDEKIKYEINVETGVKTKLKSLNINMYKSITKILGVLLDNAIDASKNTKSKKIIICVTKEKSNVVFSIHNTYKTKPNISKIGTGYTTKGKGHGYGVKLVKDIINSDKSFHMEKYLEDEYYVSKLYIRI